MTGVLDLEKFVVGDLATNCYLVSSPATRKAVLIDPGAEEPRILTSIRDKGLDVLFTINTHGHYDHIGGDAYFGFPVLIHELEEACLHDGEKNWSAFFGRQVEQVRANGLLADGDIVKAGDLSLKVIHTPGHTPGGISLLCGSLLFSGDTLFREGVGRTDLPGGSREEIISSIWDKLFKLPDDTRVLPGHGPETTIGHEKDFLGGIGMVG
ncbi:MAG: MBL fold metallo-hydrolase [Candidatus Omnitrophica bacterium]|nr:MBL fold metallo-hydrolase [Candidatus Omnitrophota bacterium]